MQGFKSNKGERHKPYRRRMRKIYIGIDNGVTGSVGFVGEGISYTHFIKTPVIHQQDYTKTKKNISRIDVKELQRILSEIQDLFPCVAVIERPMKNPARFEATCSAMRALEAELTVLELLKIPYMYIDSKEWQKEMLPKGVTGASELKKASLDIGERLFPSVESKHPDRDGLLIAEYARRKSLL